MFNGTVVTSAGKVRGVEADGCWLFLGLRYAAPVTGRARFMPPQPVEPWGGVRAADEPAPIAPQPASGIGSYVPGDPMEQGEDCLALNVWTPACDDAKRPVIVFLHGGAFLSGTGSSVMYRGESFAKRGVVLVTANYRLGVLGFLAHPSLDEPGTSFANRGLLDQLEVLEWVRTNVSAFGGDPNNVTIAGESAGAMSIADLLSLERTRRLVRRAVLESGATLVASMKDGARRAEQFFGHLGMAEPRLDALASAPLAELLAAQDVLANELGGAASMPFRPVLDGRVLEVHPDACFAAGATAGIDLLVGTNRDEFRLFTFTERTLATLDDQALYSLVERYLTTSGIEVGAEVVVERYRSAHEARDEPSGPKELFELIGSDLVFRSPMLRLASAHGDRGGRAFCYRFDWQSPFAGGVLGACHALELPFVFGTLANPIIGMFSGSGDEAHCLSEEMQASWVAFATRGNPSVAGLVEWPEYQTTDRITRIFGGDTALLAAPLEEERSYLDEVLPRYGGLSLNGSELSSTEGT